MSDIPRSRARLKEWAARGLLLLVSTLVSLVLAEVVVRLREPTIDVFQGPLSFTWSPSQPYEASPDPEVSIGLTPGFVGEMIYTDGESHAVLKRVPVRVSSLGIRGPEPASSTPGSFRVLGLGDSMTFGQGVLEEQTYLSVLSHTWKKSSPVEVINAAVPAWTTSQEVAWLERYGKNLSPHLVTLGFFVNDVEEPPPSPRPGMGLPNNILWPPPPWVGQIRTSPWQSALLGRWWRYQQHRRLASHLMAPSQDHRDHLRRQAVKPQILTRLDTSIQRLGQWCEVNRARCVVLLIPLLETLPTDPLADILDLAAGSARKYGLEVVDLTPALLKDPFWELLVFPADPHPSELAHRRMGEYLAHWLEEHPERGK